MRRARLVFLALASLGLAATAFADAYSDIKRSNPEVERAVAALPSSGINGSLNRLSNALDRMSLDSLTPSQERRIESGLEQLENDLRNGLPYLGIQDRLIVAQVAEIVVLDVVPALFPDAGAPPCPPGYGEWRGDCHAATLLLADGIAELLEGSIREGFDLYALQNPGVPVPPVPPAPTEGQSAESFGSWIDDVLEGPGAIFGPEHIDE